VTQRRTGAPGAREKLGFRDGDKGTHSSRTLMLAELQLLLRHAAPATTMPEYRTLVVEENVLGKPTRTTREHTVRKLKALYGLEPEIPVFRTLVQLWPIDEESHPLLAFLAGHARDPLLRLATPAVLDLPPGQTVGRPEIEAVIHQAFPGRFTKRTAEATASNLLSSFTQSGHLEGKVEKRRSRPVATPVAAAYAFYLAYLEGLRAQRIFSSIWVRILDVPEERLPELARDAARRGLMDYRQVGNVVELRFPNWLSAVEEELTREQ